MILAAGHQLDFAQCVSRQVDSVASFAKPKKELFREGPPLKSGSLRGRQEVHHEIYVL